jgi:aminodeoxyfutalosine deaminase
MPLISADYIFDGTQFLPPHTFLDVNEYGHLLAIVYNQQPNTNTTHYEGIICPGFINTHCHLELSALHQKINPHQGLLAFLPQVTPIRQSLSNHQLIEATLIWQEQMWRNGIQAVADICNTNISLDAKKQSKIKYHNFIEVFGLNQANANSIITQAKTLLQEFEQVGASCITPHAPYSISKPLFEALNQLNSNQLYSIHINESQQEAEYIQHGKGPFEQWFTKLLNQPPQPVLLAKNSFDFINQLLPNLTQWLWVHHTYTQQTEIDFAIQQFDSNYWCTCPKANLFLENTTPQHLNYLLQHNQTITIGTDSLASNDNLCVFQEIKILQQKHNIPTAELLKMATFNGANALKMPDLGRLKEGTNAGLVHIKQANSLDITHSNSHSIRIY